MSTVHTVHQVDDTIMRLRRRPAETSTNAKNARAAFHGEARAQLPVPKFINDYNHSMNGVDIADQLREGYETQRKAWRNWWPLFYFIIDQSCINAYLIWKSFAPSRKNTHLRFRTQLYLQLLGNLKESKINERFAAFPVERFDTHVEHILIRVGENRKTCAWCAFCNHQVRNFGGEKLKASGVKRPNCTLFRCGYCNYSLCQKGDCFFNFHSATEVPKPLVTVDTEPDTEPDTE